MALVDPEQEKLLKKAKSGSKYKNRRVKVGDMWFDSEREAERWKFLVALQRNGNIGNLKRQVVFEFVVNGVKICKYSADFTYECDGKMIVEDAKGCRTRMYRVKKKLMRAVFGIEIKET